MGKMMFAWVFVGLCILAVRGEREFTPSFQEELQHGVEVVLSTGNITTDLKNTLGTVGLENIFYEDRYKRIGSKLLCGTCNIVFGAIIAAYKNGLSKETLSAMLAKTCKALKIQTETVCDSLIKFNIDYVSYIFENKQDLSAVNMCAIIFQDFKCQPAQAANWTINIHEDVGEILQKPESTGEVIEILHLTDIHYDPFYKVGALSKCDKPLCCQADSGDVNNERYAAGSWGDYNKCDVSKQSLMDSLKHIHRQQKNIQYIYFTGDVISHRLWGTGILDNTHDMVTVNMALAEIFGTTPVFPIVGNHEPHPLNVWSPEGVNKEISTQWLFDLISELWGKWLPESTKETIKKGGYYTVLVRPKFRIIAINSNVAYAYNWWLIYDDVDPYGQLQWMENVLYESEQKGESVHILSHIPSGDHTCYIPWAKQFRRIVNRYHRTITGIFNGHTHKDEMILYHSLEDETKPISVAWNGGSLTPFTAKNPNYRILSVDAGNYNVLDFDQYTYNITDANLTPNQSPHWYKLYSFKDAYGVNSLQPEDINKLVHKMATNITILEQYNRFMHREGPAADDCNASCMRENLCSTVTSVFQERKQCEKLIGKIK